jgi:hypothetical protein
MMETLADALKAIDVTKEPRRVAQGAMLLESVQEHEQKTARLAAQVEEFLAGKTRDASANGHKPLADWAFEVLSDSAGPMRYREIAAEIRGRGFRHAREPKYGEAQLPDSVWSAMHEDPKKRFTKVGRGVWDLSQRANPGGN